jgi:hypothetical protein
MSEEIGIDTEGKFDDAVNATNLCYRTELFSIPVTFRRSTYKNEKARYVYPRHELPHSIVYRLFATL